MIAHGVVSIPRLRSVLLSPILLLSSLWFVEKGIQNTRWAGNSYAYVLPVLVTLLILRVDNHVVPALRCHPTVSELTFLHGWAERVYLPRHSSRTQAIGLLT